MEKGAAAGAALAVAHRRAALGGLEILAGRCNCGWWWCGSAVKSWTDLEAATAAVERANVDPWSAEFIEVAERYRKATTAATAFGDVNRLRKAIVDVKVSGIAADQRRRFLAALEANWHLGAAATKAWRPGRKGEQEKGEITVALKAAREFGWTRNTPALVAAILVITGLRHRDSFKAVAKSIETADQRRKRTRSPTP